MSDPSKELIFCDSCFSEVYVTELILVLTAPPSFRCKWCVNDKRTNEKAHEADQ